MNHKGPVNWIEGWVNDLDKYEEPSPVSSQGLGVGWNSLSSGSVFPPDCTCAVGPTNVIAASNSGLRFYNKTGTQQFSTTWSSFFSGIQPGGTFTSDPKVMYDHLSGRWFVIILALNNSTLYSYYLIAVSDDSDPNGTWKKYSIDSTTNGGAATSNFSDYPGLGVSAEAIYITANMFGPRPGGSFQYVKLRIIPKQQLLDFASSLTWSDIWNITTSDSTKAQTMQPAMHWGSPQAPFCVSFGTSTTKAYIYGVNDPLGSPTLTKKSVTITAIGTPGSASQSGGTVKLDTIDTRPYNAAWRNNSLYFGHTSSATGGSQCRWYQINTSSWPASASLTTSGSVTTASKYRWFPSVAVNKNDILFIGHCFSSSSDFASINYTYRLPTDSPGSTATPLLVLGGTRYYTGEGGSPVRWGDYSGAAVDPADDETFWHYNLYPNGSSGGTWNTWVQQITIPLAPGEPTTLVAADTAGAIGESAQLTATLTKTSDGTPLSGKSVSFKVSGTTVGSANTNALGLATLDYAIAESVGVGAKTITADFAADGTYNASTDTATLTVSKANVGVVVPNQSGSYGQTVSLTATLTRTTDGAPLSGKTLTFKVDGVTVTTGATNGSGVASVSYPITTAQSTGAHTISAEFAGDTNYNAGSGNGTLTVNKANTAVPVNSPSGTFGQTVALTATLTRTTDNSALSGKTVGFTVDGGSVGSAVTNGSGIATVNYLIPNGQTVGAHPVSASFAGDSQYNSSNSNGTLTINKGNTAVAANSPSATFGQSVNLTATLTRTSDSAPLGGQTVNFSVDGGSVGSAVTNGSGVATFNYAIPDVQTVGAHPTSAAFSGNAQYNASSGPGTLTITKANTATTTNSPSATFGQSVALTASLTRTTDNANLSGKTVDFSVDGGYVGSGVTDGSGMATFNYAIPDGQTAGAHPTLASFAGDARYNASNAAGVLTIGKGDTGIVANNASGAQGSSTTLQATLTRVTDGANLSGRTVNFKVDGSSVGSGVTNGSGVASFLYNIPGGMSVGSHTIDADFAGDAQYNASTDGATLDVSPGGNTVSGNVALELYLGPPGQMATLEFRDPGTHLPVYTGPITLDGAGDYSISGVPAGTYEVAVKFSNWLRQTLTGIVVSGPTTGVDFALKNGDATGDNLVDVFDMNQIFGAFGAVGANPSDLNWDNLVDIFDLNIVFGNFGLVGNN